MNQFCLAAFALLAALAHAKEEPFSIGLGVLSPSYTQTVGKENVKVNFEQKDNGFSYSVGDPKSGTNTYLNFGGSAGSQAINPAGYADANPSGYADANPSGYAGSNPSAYTGPASSSGYAAAQPNAGAYTGFAGYQGGANSGHGAPGASSGYGALGTNSGYGASGANSGYGALGANSGYGALGANSGYGSLGANSGYGSLGANSGPTLGSSGGYGSGNAYEGSSGLAGPNYGQAAAPASPSGHFGESARKPEETPSQILPAGFSYHGTEGQAFLRQGDSPNFHINDERQDSARGPAEQSFHDNFKASGPAGSGKVLANGLVGYGPGGQRGGLPVGGYAGPQFAGLVREHGGHNA